MKILIIIALGRLLIWMLQTSGPTRWIWNAPFEAVRELGECDFCLGCWVYFGLALLFKVNLLDPHYWPWLSEFLTGIIMSFGVHLAALGWHAKWGYDVIE